MENEDIYKKIDDEYGELYKKIKYTSPPIAMHLLLIAATFFVTAALVLVLKKPTIGPLLPLVHWSIKDKKLLHELRKDCSKHRNLR